MTEPDLVIPWQPATYVERLLLSNGAIVDVEHPVDEQRKVMANTIKKKYGDDVHPATSPSVRLRDQQELL